MGNDGEIFKLDDGTFWEVKYEYEYLYEYYPTVIICPGRGQIILEGATLDVEYVGSASRETQPVEDRSQRPISSSVQAKCGRHLLETYSPITRSPCRRASELTKRQLAIDPITEAVA